MGVSSSTPTPTPGHGSGIVTKRSSPGHPPAPTLAPPGPPSYLPRADPVRAAGPSARRRSCARTRRGPRPPRPPRRCASPAARRPRPTPSADDWHPPSATVSPRRSAPRSPRSIGPTSGNTRGWPTRESSSSRRRDDARRRRSAVELARARAPLLLVRWSGRSRESPASSKKNLPHCTTDARHATRRRGGRPVSRRGASSSRWEASGPGFRALAGSRRPHGDRRCQRSCRFAGFGLDLRARASSRWSAFSFWSAGGKPPSENHPPLSSPFGRPGGSKGVACLLAPKERALGDIGQAGNYSQV